jgi:hypothetical protein
VHESNVAIELVDRLPALPQKNGRRRRRPQALLADRAYDAEQKVREPLRERGLKPLIDVRNSADSASGMISGRTFMTPA